MTPQPPRSTLFPYTTLFRSVWVNVNPRPWSGPPGNRRPQDRKSTRLNSSHLGISYAVFCLKKKNATTNHNVKQRHASTQLRWPNGNTRPTHLLIYLPVGDAY